MSLYTAVFACKHNKKQTYTVMFACKQNKKNPGN